MYKNDLLFASREVKMPWYVQLYVFIPFCANSIISSIDYAVYKHG